MMRTALFLALFSGCATVMDRKSQRITFVTYPSGAQVAVNGYELGVTPCQVDVSRGGSSPAVVHLVKDGYEPQTAYLETYLNGWVFGNILFGIVGGLIGAASDAESGAMWLYENPPEAGYTLKKLPATAVALP